MGTPSEILDVLRELDVLATDLGSINPDLNQPLRPVHDAFRDACSRRGVGVMGTTKAGKSTLLNELLGCNLIPTALLLKRLKMGGAVSTTAAVTEIEIVSDDVVATWASPAHCRVSITLVDADTWEATKTMIDSMTWEGDTYPLTALYPAMRGESFPRYASYENELGWDDSADSIANFLREWSNRHIEMVVEVGKAREILIDFVAGGLPGIHHLVEKVKVEGRFSNSLLPPGVVLFDIPGAGDMNEARNAAQFEGARIIRSALLVTKEDAIGTTHFRHMVESLRNFRLQRGCHIVVKQSNQDTKELVCDEECTDVDGFIKGLGQAKSVPSAVTEAFREVIGAPSAISYADSDFKKNDKTKHFYAEQLQGIKEWVISAQGLSPSVMDDVLRSFSIAAGVLYEDVKSIPTIEGQWPLLFQRSCDNVRTHLKVALCGISTNHLQKSIEGDYFRTNAFTAWSPSRRWAAQRGVHYTKDYAMDTPKGIVDGVSVWLDTVCRPQMIVDFSNKHFGPGENYEWPLRNFRYGVERALRSALQATILGEAFCHPQCDAYVPTRDRPLPDMHYRRIGDDAVPAVQYQSTFLFVTKLIQYLSQNWTSETMDRVVDCFMEHPQWLFSVQELNAWGQREADAACARAVEQLIPKVDIEYGPAQQLALSLVMRAQELLASRSTSCSTVPCRQTDDMLLIGPALNCSYAKQLAPILSERLQSPVTVVVTRCCNLKDSDMDPFGKQLAQAGISVIDVSCNQISGAGLRTLRLHLPTARIVASLTLASEREAIEVGVTPPPTPRVYREATKYNGRRYAFLIANSAYPGVRKLTTPDPDCQLLETFLNSKEFDSVSRRSISNQSEWNALLQEVRAKQDGAVVFFFAGHGGVSSHNHCHVLELLDGSIVNVGVLYAALDNNHPKVFIYDCCQRPCADGTELGTQPRNSVIASSAFRNTLGYDYPLIRDVNGHPGAYGAYGASLFRAFGYEMWEPFTLSLQRAHALFKMRAPSESATQCFDSDWDTSISLW